MTMPVRFPRAGATRPAVAAFLAGLFVLALAAGASSAANAPKLTERVTDLAGVLTSSDRQTAHEGIDRLDQQHNIQLWALFVDTTGNQTATDYAGAVFSANGLGGNDALLVVATGDRRDALWIGSLLTDSITEAEQARILADSVEPDLAAGAWGTAVADGADALGAASSGGGTNGGGTTPAPSPADFGWLAWFLSLLLILVGVAIVWWWVRGWLAGHREAEERDRRTGELARRANALLVATDELLRNDVQELGFAEAEFGADAVKPFHEALDAARKELQAAFTVRQQLDDDVPEDPPTRERMLNEIVSRCQNAQAAVEKETDRFRELRDLERRAPQILAALPAELTRIEGRIPGVEEALAGLEADAPSAAAPVRGNVAEARKRLALAREAEQRGRAAGADKGAAARAAKAGPDAAAQAGGLLDAIDRASQGLDAARTQLPEALARARTDVEAAANAVAAAKGTVPATDLATAQSRLKGASEAATGEKHDLVLALRLATEAQAAGASVLAAIKAGEEQRARVAAAADASIAAAAASVERASDYLDGRRHGVGRQPRTRLSDAVAALDQARAVRESDPAQAQAQAQRALGRADEAYRMASDEFERTNAAGYGGTVVLNGRPYSMGRRGGPGWGNDVGAAILGGIIGGILSGGGRRGGGWRGGGGFGGGGFGGFGGGGAGTRHGRRLRRRWRRGTRRRRRMVNERRAAIGPG